MGIDAVSSSNDLEERMSIWCSPLELDGQSCEKDDLYGSARSVPEGTRDTVAVRYARTLQQGGCPL